MESDIKVAVVVPLYKPTLTIDERCSLEQLQRVLGGYPRIFIAPESLSPNYGRLSRGFATVYFPTEYFRSTADYSRLLLSEGFYAAFAQYDYILIHQLDAFVFADNLREFCTLGYDYIGAPVRRSTPVWSLAGARVGNGGLSLRRVASCRCIARLLAAGVMPQLLFEVLSANEDACFGWAGMQAGIDFHVPPVDEALEFAVQDDVQHVQRRLVTGWRPFGCHGWSRQDDEFWRPLVARALGHPTGPSLAQQGRGYLQKWKQTMCSRWQARDYLSVMRLYGLVRRRQVYEAAALVEACIRRRGFAYLGCTGIVEDIAYIYRQVASLSSAPDVRAYLLDGLLTAVRQILMTSKPEDTPDSVMQCLLDAAYMQPQSQALQKLLLTYRDFRAGKGALVPVEPSIAADEDIKRHLRIYVVMHKIVPVADDPAYQPILVGPKARVAPLTLLTDGRGENIAKMNPRYCELTALYWAWKNDDLPEYVGMCHYRRYLYVLDSRLGLRGVLSGEHILALLQDCDILLPQAQTLQTSVAEQFCFHHGTRPLAALVKVLERLAPECMAAFQRVMAQKKEHFYNIFVMRREEFCAYMAWLFPILFATEQEMHGFTADGRDRYQQRLGGFLAERLLNVYVEYRGLRVAEASVLCMD